MAASIREVCDWIEAQDAFNPGRWENKKKPVWLCCSPLRPDNNASFLIFADGRNCYDRATKEKFLLSEVCRRLGIQEPPWRDDDAAGGVRVNVERLLANEKAKVKAEEAKRKDEEARRKAEEDKAKTERARAYWNKSKPINEHPYLREKEISIEGLRGDYEGNLLVPAFNMGGELISLERIAPDGDKKHLGPKGGTFFPYGDFSGDSPIFLAEGFATAMSVHELTGNPVVCCFGSVMDEVGPLFATKYPGRELFACPDNDAAGDECAERCRAIGLPVLEMPVESKVKDDWNDIHTRHGLEDARGIFAVHLDIARAGREIMDDIPPQEAARVEEAPAPTDAPADAPAGKPRRFKLKRIGEFEVKPPEFLVKTLLEKDTLISIFGPPESGKSFIALSLAACVSTGLPFMGRHVEEGPIVYAAGEGKNGILRRTAAWEKFNQVSLKEAPFYLSEGTADFLDDAGLAEVVEAADEVVQIEGQPPRLIVVDTVSRAFGAGDENSSQDMKKFVDSLDFLRNRYSGAVVLAVHHSGVAETSRGRGSYVLRAALDSEFKISMDGDIIKMEATKMKDAARPSPMHFTLEDVPLGETIEGDAFGSAAIQEIDYTPAREERMTPSQRMAMETYRQAAKESPVLDDEGRFVGVHLDDWQPVFFKASTASTYGGKWRAFDRARKELTAKGKLNVENDIYTAVEPADTLLLNDYAKRLKSLSDIDKSTNIDNVDFCRYANPVGISTNIDTPLKGCRFVDTGLSIEGEGEEENLPSPGGNSSLADEPAGDGLPIKITDELIEGIIQKTGADRAEVEAALQALGGATGGGEDTFHPGG